MKLFLVIAIFTVVFWGQTVARPSSFEWRLTPNWPYLPRLLSVPIVQLPQLPLYYSTNEVPIPENQPPNTGFRDREPTTKPPPTYAPPRPEKLIRQRQSKASKFTIEKVVEVPLKYIVKLSDADAESSGVPLRESTFVLAPSAKAVAAEGGTAIAAPLARAIIPPNTRATVIFHPESVAIAGPGGRAHAHADLEIYSYQ